ncbi:hypothetical protein [Streptomyces sp. R08]|uniref:TrbL/VirB6 plasmid conjugal transfer protein n=1 Tax=Streptomyces sp. R08 TaxID=3238624 RepID=A0AB39M3S9_9ACTN
MECTTGNPVIDLVKGFFSFLGDPVGTIVDLIAKTILAGAVAVFAALATHVPTLDVAQADQSKSISGDTQWIVVYLAVGSLLFAAARMALERKGTAGVTALKGILRVVLVSGAATTVLVAAAAVSDSYSDYLFNSAVQESLNNVGACSDGNGIQSFLLLVLAFLLLIAGIIHTVLMYIRLGVMMLLLGTLPLAAAASMTDWGAGWWRKHIGWMTAWLLYKPAVALVLNAGMRMIDAGHGSDINTRIAGIGVMLLSAIALPALLKLVVPAAAAMGTGNPMSSMGQAGSQLASGAVMVGSLGGAGSGGGAQVGPSGASGATGSGGSSGSGGSPGASGDAGASGPGGVNGGAGAGRAGAAGGGAAAGGEAAAAALSGPAGMAVLAAVAAVQTAGSTVSGAVEGADGELGNNK